jgi:ribosomal protein L33
MKSHEEIKPFKCDQCEKEFYVMWRMKKHIEGHGETKKYCHFFNNKVSCPYDDVGCKFNHEESSLCRLDYNCRFKLCQFRHSKNDG